MSRFGTKILQNFSPETAHKMAIRTLQYGLAPMPRIVQHESLKTSICGMNLPNPLGLAAGFDKNANAINGLANAGFGFIEVGAVTPKAQPGNQKPRMFRLKADQAVINRFGFNNDGADVVAERLAKRPSNAIIGLNLGANKDSADRSSDFGKVLERCAEHLDFATVNISSPNTEKLRDLQGKEALTELLDKVISTNQSLTKPLPIFLKIAPDLDISELEDIAEIANSSGISAIITTNTTLDRDGLTCKHAHEKGGLSGAPIFEKSTRVLARISTLTQTPLIGVGGISSAEQAYAKIQAGASALQLYTALAYHGLDLIPEILDGLANLLDRDGFKSVQDAVGSNKEAWL